MTWKPVIDSTTADPSDMNGNFSHVAVGTVLPRSSVGSSFAPTDGVYNIGEDANRYNTLFATDIVTSSVTSDNAFWMLDSQVTLSGSASDIEFTGLNGDDVFEYMIIAKLVANVAGGAALIHYNGVSASTDVTGQGMAGDGGSAFATSWGEGGPALCNFAVDSATSGYSFCRLNMYTRTGQERISLLNSFPISTTAIKQIITSGYIWDDTSTTITSLKVVTLAGGQTLEAGSVVQIWSR